MTSRRRVRRVAMVSVHTSPLEQPGKGDAGGMNVYIDAVARRMARRGVEVEVFTRATSSDQAPRVDVEPGYAVRHVLAGPFGGVAKEDLPGLLCPFAAQVVRAATPSLVTSGGGAQSSARYDVIHSHYWLSGLVGLLARERWGIPLVHSAHTLAKVKNASLADRDRREPRVREVGEESVTADADVLVAPTWTEARQLTMLYDAEVDRISVVPPGVDVEVFRPAAASDDERASLRASWGMADDDVVLAFAGRIQPHKGPEVLVRALAELKARHPERRIGAVIVGNASGSGHQGPARLAALARSLGVANHVRLLPAQPSAALAAVFRAADVVAVPSFSESFGLVALEAQACGTPVVASSVGGLPVAVHGGVSGLLVDGHATGDWADALGRIAFSPLLQARMSVAARAHAEDFSWEVTVDRLLQVYAAAVTAPMVRLEAGA